MPRLPWLLLIAVNHNKAFFSGVLKSHICTFYSLFHSFTSNHLVCQSQLWVWVMLATQPFFIGGIEDVEAAQKSAFGASAMFGFVVVLSAVGMWYDATFSSQKEAEIVHASDEPVSDYQLAGAGGPTTYGTQS
mmetsp:Transcript_18152/g.43889  ORF Transcript_18152/g.43889 Transcript_18152/m.43889 type:complete len:133 (-) Transcript_18152:36-434(-)